MFIIPDTSRELTGEEAFYAQAEAYRRGYVFQPKLPHPKTRMVTIVVTQGRGQHRHEAAIEAQTFAVAMRRAIWHCEAREQQLAADRRARREAVVTADQEPGWLARALVQHVETSA